MKESNIDTDVIIPLYTKIHDHKTIKHAMEGLDPKFPEKVSGGRLSGMW